jgi:hypothetical protein
MITLATLSTIWLIISIYRIYKKVGSWKKWDPFEGTIVDYMGVLIGGGSSLIFAIWFCIKYLP